MTNLKDVSKHFKGYNPYDAFVGAGLIEREATPEAIVFFSEHCDGLTDYAYWFFLSTLWVSYSGWSDLQLWKKLFSNGRGKRKHSIMKPSEVKKFDFLPYFVTAYRAHRKDEQDWIAYTLDLQIAIRFAKERNVKSISEYRIKKQDILALFLRRGEEEIIVLDKTKAKFQREIFLINN